MTASDPKVESIEYFKLKYQMMVESGWFDAQHQLFEASAGIVDAGLLSRARAACSLLLLEEDWKQKILCYATMMDLLQQIYFSLDAQFILSNQVEKPKTIQ